MPTITETTDAAGSTATTYQLGSGGVFFGNLSSTSDVDWVRVTLVAGQTYTFAVTSGAPGSVANGVDDTTLTLYNSSGTQIAFNDDAGSGYTFSTLTYTCTQSGTYYLAPGSYNSAETGSYLMSMTTGTSAFYNPTMAESAILMTGGSSWASAPATPIVVTYGFRSTAPGYDPTASSTTTFSQLTTQEMDACREALARWSEICGITFVEVHDAGSAYTNNATILFSNYNDPTDGAGAFAYYPGSTAFGNAAGDVYLNLGGGVSTTSNPVGSWTFFAIMHELGHAIGLSHPGGYNAGPGVQITYQNDAEFPQDTHQYTVMSYFDETNTGASYGGGYAEAPMLYDIMAAQALYGVNTTTRKGNTIYGFNSNAGHAVYDFAQNADPAFCIWDAGGIDTIDASGFSMAQTINLTEGAFSNIGGLTANISIAYGAVIENATGGAGNDTITGNAAANVLIGGAGNDSLTGGLGNDTLDGGAGAGDSVRYSDATAGVTVNLSIVGVAQNTVGAGSDTISNVENVYGSNFIDHLTGSTANNLLSGLGGNDVLDGGSGNDTLLGGSGNDSVVGGAGDDKVQGGAGNDTLDGGTGLGDLVSYVDATAGVTVSLAVAAAQNTGGSGTDTIANFENLTGSKFNDSLTGNAGDNILLGGLGNDTLNGGSGGVDTASYADATAGVTVSLALVGQQNTVSAGLDTLVAIDNLIGSAFGDTLTGDGNNNQLTGGAGVDVLSGGLGDDLLLGGAGNDTLDGGGGTGDTASYADATAAVTVNLATIGAQNTGGGGTDTLSNIENLIGSKFADTLKGTVGVNVITGGAGRDTMTGAGGNDIFRLTAKTDTGTNAANSDVITDFNAGDKIDLSLIDANSANGAGNDAFSNIIVSAFTHVAGQLQFTTFADPLAAGGMSGLLSGDINGDGTADFAITLRGVTTLNASSITL